MKQKYYKKTRVYKRRLFNEYLKNARKYPNIRKTGNKKRSKRTNNKEQSHTTPKKYTKKQNVTLIIN